MTQNSKNNPSMMANNLAEKFRNSFILHIQTDTSDYILQENPWHRKQYLERTGNCIHYPNDFSVQIYAQTVLSVLLPESSAV